MKYPLIGISGAARSGKDTLCRALIRFFKTKEINSRRVSIAGDIIKNDLKNLIFKKIGLDTFTEHTNDKKILRPLLVEYGKLMRTSSEGRYFIDKFQEKDNIITIIPDIRYAEFKNDELDWIKNENNGFLIFINHEYIKDANITEKVNNKIIKKQSDFKLKWSTLNEKNPIDMQKINDIAEKIGSLYLNNYHLPIGQTDAFK